MIVVKYTSTSTTTRYKEMKVSTAHSVIPKQTEN